MRYMIAVLTFYHTKLWKYFSFCKKNTTRRASLWSNLWSLNCAPRELSSSTHSATWPSNIVLNRQFHSHSLNYEDNWTNDRHMTDFPHARAHSSAPRIFSNFQVRRVARKSGNNRVLPFESAMRHSRRRALTRVIDKSTRERGFHRRYAAS